MPDIMRDAELLKNLGRLVEAIPAIDTENGTSIAAFGDLEAIGMVNQSNELFEFQEEGDTSLPFHLQGSEEFQNAQAMELRRQLKLSPKIIKAIQQFWRVFPKLVIDDEDVITKDEYMQVMLLIFKVLRSSDFERTAAIEQIEKDWTVDSKSKDSMNAEVFLDALFELVDVWTCDIEESTYVRFLDLLFKRISVRAIVFFEGTVIKVTLDDSDKSVHELMAQAVPLATLSAFSHIARYMGNSEISTMGDLAKAEAEDVERMRLDYIERNQLSTEMFGSDLFQVLDLIAKVTSVNTTNLTSLSSLSHADPALIDSIRQEFIKSNNISLKKETIKENILKELEKFGIDTKILKNDTIAIETYLNLYDLFLIKTGGEISNMAKKDLSRIKNQMERHGVYVPENMVEEKYKEFYNTVIKTTGDQVVKGAKKWIVENSNEISLASIIKEQYDEFKQIDDAKAFTDDDAEFVLLTVQEDGNKKEKKSLILNNLITETIKSTEISNTSKEIGNESTNLKLTLKNDPKINMVQKETLSQSKNEEKFHGMKQGKANRPLPSKTENHTSNGNKDHTTHTKEKKEPLKDKPHRRVSSPNKTKSSPPIQVTDDKTSKLQLQEDKSSEIEHNTKSEMSSSEMTETQTTEGQVFSETKANEVSANIAIAAESSEELTQSEATIEWGTEHVRIQGHHDERHKKARHAPKNSREARIVVGGITQDGVPSIARYIQLLGFGEVIHAKSQEEAFIVCDHKTGPGADLVCFVIGNQLDCALSMLEKLMELAGPRIILIGGNKNQPDQLEDISTKCISHGAIYFASMPVDFKDLRNHMQEFLEDSKQKFIFRRKQEKTTSTITKALDKYDPNHLKPNEGTKTDSVSHATHTKSVEKSSKTSWFTTNVKLPSLKNFTIPKLIPPQGKESQHKAMGNADSVDSTSGNLSMKITPSEKVSSAMTPTKPTSIDTGNTYKIRRFTASEVKP